MAALPYMMFSVSEYLADTTHLDAEENGAYLLLLFYYWQTGKPIPNNDTLLAKIARVSPDRWPAVRSIIEHLFNTCSTEWQHARIEVELLEAQEKVEAKSRGGKASAAARKRNAIKERKSGAARPSKELNTCSTPVEHMSNKVEVEVEVDKENIKPLSSKPDPVTDIFNYWVSVMGKTSTTKPTPERVKAVKARLQQGYTPDQIRIAIDNCRADPWSMGDNDRQTPFNDLELICRTGKKLESFIDKTGGSHAAHRPGSHSAADQRGLTPAQRTAAKRESLRLQQSNLGIVATDGGSIRAPVGIAAGGRTE